MKQKSSKLLPTAGWTAFHLFAPDAREVKLAGDFNEWKPEAMQKSAEEYGVWEIRRKLGAGEYQYKFVVDEVWHLDPECTITICNSFGTYNSVVRVS